MRVLSPKNYPVLSLPDSPETVAFRGVEQVLRTDPQLQATVDTFLAWRGEVEDDWLPAFSNCPYLRIEPVAGDSDWETEGQHNMPLLVRITTAVVGSNYDTAANLWGAVRSALWPSDTTRAAWVSALLKTTCRINRGILQRPAYGVFEDTSQSGSRITACTGTLKLVLLIDTP